jgi:NTE family protein
MKAQTLTPTLSPADRGEGEQFGQVGARFFFAIVCSAALLALGCAHGKGDRARPTCLVLSVGGPDGVAHLGAIAAVKEAGLPVSCVVGSSMGALVGGLYASAPADDTRRRFETLARTYEAETRADARRNGIGLGILFGAAAAVIKGGVTAPVLAAGGGFLLGVEATARMDRERLVRVMDRYFEQRSIESLPVPFAALYARRNGNGVTLVAARAGNLAEAVGGSVANPFLFPELDVAAAQTLDPGADRAAATPVEDACRLFPDHALLAINVSGQPLFYSARMTCPVREVTVAAAGLAPEEALAFGPAFDRAVSAGHAATRAALAR